MADISSPSRFFDRRSPPHIATLIFMAALSALTMNIFLPSLPAMAEHFGAEYHTMQLAVSLFLVANAVLQLAIGPISDYFGRRPVLLVAIGIYIVATVGVLVAPTVEFFLFCRMLQAVIVAGMVLSRAVVRDVHPPEESAAMISYVTMGMSIAPMIGPTIGGLLDERFGWQASFSLLLVGGVALFWLVWADLGETAAGGRTGGFAAQIRSYPLLLGSGRFWCFCLAAALTSGVWFAFIGGAPFVGTTFYGLTPMQLGIGFIAPALGYGIGNFIAARISITAGIDRMVMAGNAICLAAAAVLVVLAHADMLPVAVFFGMLMGVGIGNGFTIPNATAGMLSIRPELAGSASGLGGAVMLGMGALCATIAAALLTPGAGSLPLLHFMLAIGVMSLLPLLGLRRR